ncbi:MAG: N-acetyl-gamma-glutamyl-phosphate reductase [Geminicoccaceae bacterium]
MAQDKARIAILGATGYTGVELLRLLDHHPRIDVAALTADRHAGKPIAAVFPHLVHRSLPDLVKIDDVDFGALDGVFCCLPAGMTQDLIGGWPRGPKIVDFSADFRLRDPAVYEEAYGRPHSALETQKEAVYGLSELARGPLKSAWLVANPGCHTTTAQLPLKPLLAAGAIDPDEIIIDTKTGISGAGRSLREDLLFCESNEGCKAYGIGFHRHMPELQQGLDEACGRPVAFSFTPHLLPLDRGILATIYVRLSHGRSLGDLRNILFDTYRDEAFVHLCDQAPAVQHVRGTNLCLMSVHGDRRPGHAIIISVIDNLLKGASGQALQNMNIVLGFEEGTGLPRTALLP